MQLPDGQRLTSSPQRWIIEQDKVPGAASALNMGLLAMVELFIFNAIRTILPVIFRVGVIITVVIIITIISIVVIIIAAAAVVVIVSIVVVVIVVVVVVVKPFLGS